MFGYFVILFGGFLILCCLYSLMVTGEMACTKQTARVVQEGTSNGDITFDFGLSRVVQSDLNDFVRDKWLPISTVSFYEGEVKPNPHGDEVVVFKEFFEASLLWPPTRLLFGR